MPKKSYLILPVVLFLALASTSAKALELPSSESSRLRPTKTPIRALVGDKIASRSATLEQRREDFKIHIQEIKDTHKQKILEDLDKSYVNINNRWTSHFKNVLERLTEITNKLKTLAVKQNKTEAISKLDNITVQISTLKTDINNQSQKTYTLDLSDTTKLKDTAQSTHRQLRTNLETIRAEIKAIHDTLKQVLLTLKPEPKITLPVTVTITPTP